MYSLFFLYLSEQIYKIMKIKLLLIGFLLAANALGAAAQVSKTYYVRSEERRVGKECRSRWSPYH